MLRNMLTVEEKQGGEGEAERERGRGGGEGEGREGEKEEEGESEKRQVEGDGERWRERGREGWRGSTHLILTKGTKHTLTEHPGISMSILTLHLTKSIISFNDMVLSRRAHRSLHSTDGASAISAKESH